MRRGSQGEREEQKTKYIYSAAREKKDCSQNKRVGPPPVCQPPPTGCSSDGDHPGGFRSRSRGHGEGVVDDEEVGLIVAARQLFLFGFFLVSKKVVLERRLYYAQQAFIRATRASPTAWMGATTVASAAATAPAAMMARPIFLVVEVIALGASILGGSGSARVLVLVLVEAHVVVAFFFGAALDGVYRAPPPPGARKQTASAA